MTRLARFLPLVLAALALVAVLAACGGKGGGGY
jgi:predicted small lipoprotein YifL